MNKLAKALIMPKKRLLKKILGANEVYAIGFRKVLSKGLLEESKSINIYDELFASDSYWYADPILFKYGNSVCLFLEKFDVIAKKGEIACSLYKGNSFDEPISIIQEPFHMSYPTVFSFNNELFMIPETSADYSIRLYRCDSFPYKWKLYKRFDVDYEIVDSNVIDISGNCVSILASRINKNNPLTCCFIKYQILFDLSNNISLQIVEEEKKYNLFDRLAGSCFYLDGLNNQLILPTQESTSIDYGVNIIFKRINENYSIDNKIVKKITPDLVEIKGINRNSYIGIHTYAKIDSLEVIDIRYLK